MISYQVWVVLPGGSLCHKKLSDFSYMQEHRNTYKRARKHNVKTKIMSH
jgi:hypothetical protein